MRSLLIFLLLSPTFLFADSPFDGTWVANLNTIQLPRHPEIYLLQNGTYECSTCVPKINVKADGKDHPVAGSPYFSSIAVRVIDPNSIEITEKMRQKTVYSEMDTVSSEGNTLVEKITDMAAANDKPETATETFKRVSAGPVGSSSISGSWQAAKIAGASENGTSVTYHSIQDGLQAENPNGEGYSAKFDGHEYPIHGDPGHNTVSLRRVNAHTIVETDRQDGAVHYQVRMTVSHDGKSMRVTEIDNERGDRTTYILEKRAQ